MHAKSTSQAPLHFDQEDCEQKPIELQYKDISK